ncbi:MAG: hypothetical protein LBC12_05245 [Nitrososphaerota archaeon]|jgi:hypothetical protein|nr:hypothetical protein [Nitrososphaerota archaeon]
MRTITRTIRLPRDTDNNIILEAEQEGLPISSFLNKIIEQHFTVKKFQAYFGCMLCSPQICTPVVAMTGPDKLTIAAQTAAHEMSKRLLFTSGNSIKIESVLPEISKIFGNQDLKYIYFNDPSNSITFLIHNNIHPKWTLYMATFLETVFNDIFKNNIKCKINGNMVKINI